MRQDKRSCSPMQTKIGAGQKRSPVIESSHSIKRPTTPSLVEMKFNPATILYLTDQSCNVKPKLEMVVVTSSMEAFEHIT